MPEEKRATTQKTDLGETRFGGLGRLLVLLWRSPFFGRSFWVAGAPGLPSSLLACVLGPAWFWLLSFRLIFSVYGRRKTFRYPLPRVFITYYLFTNKNEVYAVLMELDETVRNRTFHLKVPSSSLSVVSSPLTRLSCASLHAVIPSTTASCVQLV